MLSILAAADADARRLSLEAGIDSPAACMVAQDGEETVGWVLYRTEGEQIDLLSARAKDNPVLDGLLRGAMHTAYLRNMRYAVCRNPQLFPALKALHFTKGGEEYSCSLSEFFHRPCHHGGKKLHKS